MHLVHLKDWMMDQKMAQKMAYWKGIESWSHLVHVRDYTRVKEMGPSMSSVILTLDYSFIFIEYMNNLSEIGSYH